MSDTNDSAPAVEPTSASAPPPYSAPQGEVVAAAPAAPAAPYQAGSAPVGKIRGTGACILLMIITFGIYGIWWYYKTHEEMKRHSGQGIGGALALLLAVFVGIVLPYINSSEVGRLYELKGQQKPVSGATGLWYFPGIFILVGPIVWFVKTNGALNAYWRSQGAQG